MTKILGTTMSGVIIDELSTFTVMETQDIMQTKQKLRLSVFQKLNDPLYHADLVNFIMENCVVSGGCSASIFHAQEPNDYDLYFKTQEALDKFNTTFLTNKKIYNIVKDVNINYMNTTVNGKLITAQAVTLFNDIQLITMGTIKMIDTFDFVHCKPFYDLSENRYFISKRQYESIKNKQLIINPSADRPAEPWRLHKYKERGWKQLSAY